jgi:predicted permease
MDAFVTDLRFAIRALVSRPGFSALAILTLAIGIGVNAVAFTGINGLIYKPARFAGSDTLGWITLQAQGSPYGQVTWRGYNDIAQQTSTFESIIAEGRRPLSLLDGRDVTQIWALCVSRNYLPTLRVQPVAGRVFDDGDVTATEVPVVVSERFWRNRLGAGSIAGKTLTLNARSVAIVGVLPDGFQGPGGLFEPDVWVLLDRLDVLGMGERLTGTDQPWLGLAGRVRPGVSSAQANADLQRVATTLFAGDPAAAARPRSLRFWPMPEGHPEVRGIAPTAFKALGIVGLVLLLACFNVTGLLLARAVDRQRETSVRAALGASRTRIVRQFALEGLLLAGVSGVAAIAAAAWSADLLAVFSLPSPIPQRLHLEVEPRVIAFTVALVVLGGVLPSLLPALQATRADLLRSMRLETSAGRRRALARNTFIVAQVTGSTLLLTASLLFVRSFWETSTTNPGFETARVLVLELKPSDFGYDAARTKAFFGDLLDRVRSSPAVEDAAIADRIPFYVGFRRTARVSTASVDCAVSECRPTTIYAVGQEHFKTLGIPLVAGRELIGREIQAARDGVVVGRTMAERLWPGGNAVGQWVRLGNGERERYVIGVAADVTHHTFNERPGDYLYRPIEDQDYADSITLVTRTRGEPAAFARTLQDHIRALDATLPPGAVKTMTERMEMPLWPVRTAAGFFTVCGVLALVLATVGLFGTTSLAVGQRTREFGIRAALGSTRAGVMRLVLREGLALAIPGIVLGVFGAALMARTASSVLVSIDASDVSTYAATAAVQVVAALLACVWPAHRATKADPILALRAE